eukprot:CAMPEP_0197877092 /NCGR_PEP_ID=MMETSP1439-20131203/5911_1 /TAXON_ID=66791 /ORGANISM="Gonyaulax spinifera, Strain CCMP409" /LENGTH=114 /DNA_ID=CAMNT_0043496421 /DNA_START=69 /DNA_END=413 /DNA_ORIENTATION=+
MALVTRTGPSSLQAFTSAGMSESAAQEAHAVVQKAGLGSLEDLKQAWSNAGSGEWSRLALDSEVKDKLMAYFEKDIGMTVGKMKVPPKALCTTMAGNTLQTRGGQMVGPWRSGY